ncbi:MAG: 16S rRNA (cytosine(967)-C(5))-methyltransferase RsmB [Nitrospiraceae bacterium]
MGSRARKVAFDILMEVERARLFADEALERALGRGRLDARDRALVHELVYGVLRRRGTIDWRLIQLIHRPMERLPLAVRIALRVGAYQILYLEKIPASAAVNESVWLVKSPLRSGGGKWTGLVNAVLRSLVRAPTPPWPDSTVDAPFALAVRYSCPQWLATRWVERLGLTDAEVLCRATTETPPLTLRVNTLRQTRSGLTQVFTEAGLLIDHTTMSPLGLTVKKRGPITELPYFQEGAFYVEDEAAQLIPPLLDPKPGQRVLDACAAPGGKATHLAALMDNQGEIVAIDRSPTRLRLLEENCRRLGVTTVKPFLADAREVSAEFRTGSRGSPRPRGTRIPSRVLQQPFDRILLDAPCTGLGILRRHPEGKWRKEAQLVKQQHDLQVQLLEQIAPLLRPGGILVYSTCSTESEENEQVIDDFCSTHAEFHREPVAPWLPSSGLSLVTSRGDFSTMCNTHSMDAFFAARLRKVV